MAEIDDEIARIAALRGKPLEEVLATAEQEKRRQQRVSDGEIRNLFDMPDGCTDRDLGAFDGLPKELREAIYTCPLMISAIKVQMLYQRGADVGSIIAGINDQLPSLLARQARDKYGREHPTAKEAT